MAPNGRARQKTNCCASQVIAIRSRLLNLILAALRGLFAMAVFPHDPAATIPDHIKGLIFDCDGTLVDTMPLHFAAWKEAMAAIHISITQEQFGSFAGMPTVAIIETLARDQHVACDVQ